MSNTLRCGDILTSIYPLVDGPYDVIIADPPYNNTVEFNGQKYVMHITAYKRWCAEWIEKCLACLADDGLMFIYGYPEYLMHIAVEQDFSCLCWLQWTYKNKTAPGSKWWQRSHESILVLWESDKRPPLNLDDIREPYAETSQKLIENGKTVRGGSTSRFGSANSEYVFHPKGRLPRDVLEIPALTSGAGYKERKFLCETCSDGVLYDSSEKKNHEGHQLFQHPTQKPMKLTERLIKSRIKDGQGSVLIPFAGSGSECVVAQRLGCQFDAVEIDPQYYLFAKLWLEKEMENAQPGNLPF